MLLSQTHLPFVWPYRRGPNKWDEEFLVFMQNFKLGYSTSFTGTTLTEAHPRITEPEEGHIESDDMEVGLTDFEVTSFEVTSFGSTSFEIEGTDMKTEASDIDVRDAGIHKAWWTDTGMTKTKSRQCSIWPAVKRFTKWVSCVHRNEDVGCY
jgi:hypothetical protein